jgi:hypothetical protein
VQRFACGLLQSFDFVPDHQLTALQLGNMEVVRGKMHERIMQFTFQNPMFPFQFNEMRLNCHTKSPLFGSNPQIRPRSTSVHEPRRLSTDIKNSGVIFEGLSEMNRDCRDPVGAGTVLQLRKCGVNKAAACATDRHRRYSLNTPATLRNPFAIPVRRMS